MFNFNRARFAELCSLRLPDIFIIHASVVCITSGDTFVTVSASFSNSTKCTSMLFVGTQSMDEQTNDLANKLCDLFDPPPFVITDITNSTYRVID